jgi:P4 family phage/plasmid primase-like protien
MTAPANLRPSDLAMFARLGISPELLTQASIRRVTDEEARADFGFNSSGGNSGIVFPYINPATGFRATARLRRDHPEIEIEDGKENPKNKYVIPALDKRHLYFVPGSKARLDKPHMPVCLVEAEKSALALWAWAERMGRDLVPVATGGCWGWRGRIGKAETADGKGTAEVGPLPDLILCAKDRLVYVLFDANARTNWKVRAARIALVDQLVKLKATVKVLNLPVAEGVNGPDDFIAINGDEAMEKVFDAAPESDIDSPNFSEDWLSLRFTAAHGSRLRFTDTTGRWHLWTGKVWTEDKANLVHDLAREICRQAALEFDSITPGKGKSLASAKVVSAVERLARSDTRHAITVEEWDDHPKLLNCDNGMVDLTTGQLLAHAQGFYATKITGAELAAPGTPTPLWSAFLNRITADNSELEAYLRRVAGYCLTGLTTEQCLFFAFGTGANGKSVLLGTLMGILGSYGKTASMETFLASSVAQHPTDLASLHGARLVASAETEKGRRWDEAKVKALTGGDRIAARYMRQDFFEFTPVFKLLVTGNHRPALRSVNEAIRRRMHLIPFAVEIPPAERDPLLTDKLKAEWPGILRWAVDGCLEWQSTGLNPPAVVRAATEEYLAEENTVERWIESACVLKNGYFSSTATLYRDWKTWAEAMGEFPGSVKSFAQSLEQVEDIYRHRTNDVRGFRGIALRHGDHQTVDAGESNAGEKDSIQ